MGGTLATDPCVNQIQENMCNAQAQLLSQANAKINELHAVPSMQRTPQLQKKLDEAIEQRESALRALNEQRSKFGECVASLADKMNQVRKEQAQGLNEMIRSKSKIDAAHDSVAEGSSTKAQSNMTSCDQIAKNASDIFEKANKKAVFFAGLYAELSRKATACKAEGNDIVVLKKTEDKEPFQKMGKWGENADARKAQAETLAKTLPEDNKKGADNTAQTCLAAADKSFDNTINKGMPYLNDDYERQLEADNRNLRDQLANQQSQPQQMQQPGAGQGGGGGSKPGNTAQSGEQQQQQQDPQMLAELERIKAEQERQKQALAQQAKDKAEQDSTKNCYITNSDGTCQDTSNNTDSTNIDNSKVIESATAEAVENNKAQNDEAELKDLQAKNILNADRTGVNGVAASSSQKDLASETSKPTVIRALAEMPPPNSAQKDLRQKGADQAVNAFE